MKIPADIQQAIQAYYAERATDTEIAALEAWFREDIAHVKVFAEHGMIEWQMLCEQQKADAAAILTVLREAEEHAEPVLVHLSDVDKPHRPTAKPATDQPITLREFGSVAGYLVSETLRSKAGVLGSIAAVLLLGAALYLSIFGIGLTTDPTAITDNPASEPAPAVPVTSPTVATLTATHNAVWSDTGGNTPTERALAPGSELKAGTRLTLTAGFAEITTNDGAIAILEAPATIDLLDNDNAIRLHTGKLVGICETESSRGFLVRTPHLDIVDLGTQFAIQTDEFGSEIHVLEGSVRLDPGLHADRFRPVVAEAGTSLAVAKAGTPTPIAAKPGIFYRELPEAYEQQVRDAQPLYYWQFNTVEAQGRVQGLGTAASDLLGLSEDALRADAPHSSERGNRALWLDKETQGFMTADRAGFDTSKPFTIEAWAWVPKAMNRKMRLISNNAVGDDGIHIGGFGFGVSAVGTDIADDGGPALNFTSFNVAMAVSKDSVPTDQWVHLAVTYDGQANLKMYIDGQPTAYKMIDAVPGFQQFTIAPSQQPLRIAAAPVQPNATLSEHWVGGIDEVALYNRVLNEQELLEHAQITRQTKSPAR